MSKLIIILSLLISFSTFADLYRCLGNDYTIVIRNHEIIGLNAVAMSVISERGRTTVLAKSVYFASGFTMDFSGTTNRSDQGFQDVTVRVGDFGVNPGTTITGEVTLSGPSSREGFHVICTKGNDPMPGQ
jgi:hypothetical protein